MPEVEDSRGFRTGLLDSAAVAKLAYETEKDQIENTLGLKSLVSLTDHDTIEAPMLLRTARETAQTPISLEWSVPFAETIFHLGVHNLPSEQAQSIMDDLAAYTRNPEEAQLVELLAMLDAFPDVLVVFNHPLWTQTCVGVHRDDKALERFLTCAVQFLHAFEINATRSTKENSRVRELAEQWRRPLVSGGDRHGCGASGALNLTRAETFCEFVSEIRLEQRSHVLLMPQYTEPVTVRTTRTLLDVIRNYPEYPIGSRRWDDRIFHPDANGGPDQPISSLWKAPPGMWRRYCRASACWRMRPCKGRFSASSGAGPCQTLRERLQKRLSRPRPSPRRRFRPRR